MKHETRNIVHVCLLKLCSLGLKILFNLVSGITTEFYRNSWQRLESRIKHFSLMESQAELFNSVDVKLSKI